jgi:hypothetical protein
MFRNALIASVVALGAAGAAQAQDGGPRLIGSGADTQVVYAEPSRNLVGGGVATTSGSSDDRTIAYGDTSAQAGSGLVAELTGGGDNAQLVYRPAAPADSLLAGRAARPRG